MTFEEWIAEYPHEVDICIKSDMRQAWEAGIQEGIDRMYKLYDICPECRCTEGQHRLHCRTGHESY